jgi:hypothetical protein
MAILLVDETEVYYINLGDYFVTLAGKKWATYHLSNSLYT